MERFLAATGAIFSAGYKQSDGYNPPPSQSSGYKGKKGLDEILEDARLCATSKTGLAPAKNGYRGRQTNAIKGTYELDGDLEAEVQAEVSELVTRVQSMQPGHLPMEQLLEDALEEGDTSSQASYLSMWEEKLAAKDRLNMAGRKTSKGKANDLQVVRSAASCSALQPHQRHIQQQQVVEATKSKQASSGSTVALQASTACTASLPPFVQQRPHLEDMPPASSLLRPKAGQDAAASLRGSLAFNKPSSLIVSSDSYDLISDTSSPARLSLPAALAGSPSQTRNNGRAPVLPPLQISLSRANSGSLSTQDAINTNTSTTGTPNNTKTGQQRSLQGSPLSRCNPKYLAGMLAPIPSLGTASTDKSNMRQGPNRTGVVLAPMGGSGGLLIGSRSNGRSQPLGRDSFGNRSNAESQGFSSGSPLASESFKHIQTYKAGLDG